MLFSVSADHSLTTLCFHAISDNKAIQSILTYMERDDYHPQASVTPSIFSTLIRALQRAERVPRSAL